VRSKRPASRSTSIYTSRAAMASASTTSRRSPIRTRGPATSCFGWELSALST